MAHARISVVNVKGVETDIHFSDDLAGFDSRLEAINFAQNWAEVWIKTLARVP
jgi:hypothetical protein